MLFTSNKTDKLAIELLVRARNVLSHPIYWYTNPEHKLHRKELEEDITKFLRGIDQR